MNPLSQILGRSKPTTNAITKKIAEEGANLEADRRRFAEAGSTLQRVAVLTPDEHEAAEREQAEARRAIVRAEARIVELQKVLVEAQESERISGLKARADAARRRVEVDASKALDRYEEAARKTAEAISEFMTIEAEADSVNRELRAAGLPQIESPSLRFRCKPGRVVPEVRERRTKWLTRDAFTGLEVEAAVFTVDENGERVPTHGPARKVEAEVVVSAERRLRDEWLPSLSTIHLPAARIGSAPIWPKG